MIGLKKLILIILQLNFIFSLDEIKLNCDIIKRDGKVTCLNNDLEALSEELRVNEIISDGENEISTLYLESSKMLFLPMEIFKHFPHLEELRIFTEMPQLTKIDANNFNDINSKIKRIFIGNQKIKELSPKIFSKATELTHLQLPSNNIEIIHDDTFDGLEKCQFLDLSNNRIKEISENVLLSLSSLRQFNMENNKIRNVPLNLFANNNQITKIELSGNLLEKFPNFVIKSVFRRVADVDKNQPVVTLSDNACSFLHDIYESTTIYEMNKMQKGCKNFSTCLISCKNALEIDFSHAISTIKEIINEEEKLLSMRQKSIENIIQNLLNFQWSISGIDEIDELKEDIIINYKKPKIEELKEDIIINYKKSAETDEKEDFDNSLIDEEELSDD